MSDDVSNKTNRRALNILYIMTDEQPVSCVAGFGNPVIKTPNLDPDSPEKKAYTGFLMDRYKDKLNTLKEYYRLPDSAFHDKVY